MVMVQEINLRPGGSSKLASKPFPNAFMASNPSEKAGVAILIKRSCPIRMIASMLDLHGQYVLLNCVHLKTPLTLVNVYAPNSGQIGFLTKVLERLRAFSQPFTIVGDDFNMCMSPQQRQTRPFSKHPTTPSAQTVHFFSETNLLVQPIWCS